MEAVLSRKISRVAHPIGAAERRQILAPVQRPGFEVACSVSAVRCERFPRTLSPLRGSLSKHTESPGVARG